MYQQIILTVLVAVFCLTDSAPPSFIKKCKPEDTKCLRESTRVAVPIFASGISEYGVETLDPMIIKSVNASQGNLLFLIKDASLTGLKDCEIKKVQNDKVLSKITVKLQCSAKLEGDYVLKGSVLFVPLEGQGKLHVNLKSAIINIEVDIAEKLSEEGKKYWHVKTWQYSFEFKDKSDVVFDNLYDGNEVLGRAARELISNNGNDIINEIGTPFIKHVITRIVKNINHFFKATTVEDLEE